MISARSWDSVRTVVARRRNGVADVESRSIAVLSARKRIMNGIRTNALPTGSSSKSVPLENTMTESLHPLLEASTDLLQRCRLS
jgi:hypothetical protein